MVSWQDLRIGFINDKKIEELKDEFIFEFAIEKKSELWNKYDRGELGFDSWEDFRETPLDNIMPSREYDAWCEEIEEISEREAMRLCSYNPEDLFQYYIDNKEDFLAFLLLFALEEFYHKFGKSDWETYSVDWGRISGGYCFENPFYIFDFGKEEIDWSGYREWEEKASKAWRDLNESLMRKEEE